MRKILNHRRSRQFMGDQGGFTIIELVLATLIFSVVLLLLTYGVLQITRNYYKGITSSNTQNNARNVISNISQAVQFSGSSDNFQVIGPSTTGSPKSRGFCVGNQRYSYLQGYQLVDNSVSTATAHRSHHALVEDTLAASCSAATTTAQDLTVVGALTPTSKELIGLNMRLSDLSVAPFGAIGDLFSVHVRVVYGDDVLLCSLAANDCGQAIDNFTTYGTTIPTDLTCKGQTGSQFCAISDLGTTIQKRIQ